MVAKTAGQKAEPYSGGKRVIQESGLVSKLATKKGLPWKASTSREERMEAKLALDWAIARGREWV